MMIPNSNVLLEYSSNDGHKSKPTTLVFELSLTPLSESIMMYPSCMALKVAFTHFSNARPDHLLLFYFI
jgi:hypothetical protein